MLTHINQHAQLKEATLKQAGLGVKAGNLIIQMDLETSNNNHLRLPARGRSVFSSLFRSLVVS